MRRRAARPTRRRARRVSFPIMRSGRAPWRRAFAILFALALLLAAPIMARAQGADSVSLSWSSPGDDGNVGTAAIYDLRMSTGTISLSNWNQATPVSGLPAPLIAGSTQSVTVRGLTSGTTYFFAIRTQDEAGNWSGVSNVARWDWVIDNAPPGAPTGLQSSHAANNVHLQWNANSEPDVQGYNVYRAPSTSGPWTRVSDTPVPSAQFDDAAPSGWAVASYEVSATDASGNESARSAPVTVTLGTSAPAPTASLEIQPVYPNPSTGSDPVRIPVVVPPGGVGDALLDVLDAGGHRVRRLTLSGLGTGAQTVTWDGLNDFGRAVAPGVYTLLLGAGSDRQRMRLVRTP